MCLRHMGKVLQEENIPYYHYNQNAFRQLSDSFGLLSDNVGQLIEYYYALKGIIVECPLTKGKWK